MTHSQIANMKGFQSVMKPEWIDSYLETKEETLESLLARIDRLVKHYSRDTAQNESKALAGVLKAIQISPQKYWDLRNRLTESKKSQGLLTQMLNKFKLKS